MRFRILIVDDEKMVRNSLRRSLEAPGREFFFAGSVAEAKTSLDDHDIDLVVIDYRLGDGNGMEVLDYARQTAPQAEAIVLTAYGNIRLAVEAIRRGAYDFVEKGGDPEVARHAVDRGEEKVRMRREIESLERQRLRRSNKIEMVAESRAMRALLRTARQFAATDVTVLIEGETGTGKSLIAQLIHQQSPRSQGPLITINCGAIPRELIESELFGYAQGAFTGAGPRGKAGLIERADHGTLLLDEIGDLDLELQSRLLTVLEAKEIMRVGGVEPRPIDVRFLAATNVDLEARVRAQSFRKDLFFRLNVANLRVAPLREHPEDILPLAMRFVSQFNLKFGKSVVGFSDGATKRLMAHSWPGNVREIRNSIERIVLLIRKDRIEERDLLFGDRRWLEEDAADEIRISLPLGESGNVIEEGIRRIVETAWERSRQNQSQAAKLLGVPRTTLQHHLRKFSLI